MQELSKQIEKVLINEDNKGIIVILKQDSSFAKDTEAAAAEIKKSFKGNSNINVKVIRRPEKTDLEKLLKTHWAFFCDLWTATYPANRQWIGNCSYKLQGNHINILFENEIAVHTLEDKSFKGLTQKIIRALGIEDVNISLAWREDIQNSSGSDNQDPKEDREELKEIRRIVNRNAHRESSKNKSHVLMGRSFKGTPKPIREIVQDAGTAMVEGEICRIETREIKSERFSSLLSLFVTDYEDTIECRFFIAKGSKAGITNALEIGDRIRIKGEAQYNKYSKEITIVGRDLIRVPGSCRTDDCEQKRIELHTHSRFSVLDGVAAVETLVKRAADWGHKAIAITDHGVVQAFPEAYEAAQKTGVKVIYGMEGYMVDDLPVASMEVFDWDKGQEFVVFDIETTGLDPARDKITEIGAVKIKDKKIVDSYHTLVNPCIPIPEKIVELTGINDDMVKDSPTIRQVIPAFLDFVKESILVAHNASFDMGFISTNSAKMGLMPDNRVLDTLDLTRRLFPFLKTHKLSAVAKYLGIEMDRAHRADDDARATAQIFLNCLDRIGQDSGNSLTDKGQQQIVKETLNRLKSHHIIILAQTQLGLYNLYKIVSKSHLEYFYKRPRIPKSLLLKYRDGLLLGSACEAGELFRSIIAGKNDKELERIANIYDYLEIQPLDNNNFLVKNGVLESREQLEKINTKIYELGRKLDIPVVATGDVHFLDPQDEAFRRIIMAGKGFDDADKQAPLYLKTTSEMLNEFMYLGEDAAREVVVTNPNAINSRIDNLLPIPQETFPPTIPGAELELKEITWKQAKIKYGDPLPGIVKDRLERELGAITDNGYAVMFIIAQKLVSKSMGDGYLVGSRGSVGSSLVATMSGITEVNPLPPHYLCGKCKYNEFVQDGSVGAGADLIDRICPVCGNQLIKQGFYIPFEVFMGFEGDKEPDIDLNFSGEYQAKAHRHTEELFGKEQVYRAGTISTLADKTAYGFVKGYLEERNLTVHNAEINRLVRGCAGIKRTTGQHPGGVMIVPRNMDIYQFTPVQRPADDSASNVTTTHFDYHALSGRLLKLDILGHDDPTMLRMLHKLTGKDPQDIPLDDKKTMQLFNSTHSLGVSGEDIECPVGSLGIPEFGTRFVRQMLEDTKPTTLAELVRISGLSHGTDVWLNNAQELIRNGTATLKDVISARDDIYIYLVQRGMEPKRAFAIMERVRKGKGLTDEDIIDMKSVDTPDWFIQSCRKIKYMFPKAHAVAYVTMAFRIAFYKVHYPLAFYAAYFTVRADEFDAQLIVSGKEQVVKTIKDFDNRKNDLTQREKSLLTILEIAREMYCRGFGFLPVDLYKSDRKEFIIAGEKLLPPLNSLQGLGENAAENIVEARQERPFISVEDLQERARISRTVIDILKEHRCLGNLPESNQISLF
jgi:DNA polymerase-3 subunit alpha (Gram-positive type)